MFEAKGWNFIGTEALADHCEGGRQLRLPVVPTPEIARFEISQRKDFAVTDYWRPRILEEERGLYTCNLGHVESAPLSRLPLCWAAMKLFVVWDLFTHTRLASHKFD